ncbi:MAG: TM2 domain-containing protein, partial [Burkholderiales bacterium]
MTELQLMQDMTDGQRLLFQAQMAQYRKSTGVAAILAFAGCFGLHRFYLGQIGLGLVMLITFGGVLLWAIVDLLRIGAIVEGVNRQKAQEIAAQVKMLASGGGGSAQVPAIGGGSSAPPPLTA